MKGTTMDFDSKVAWQYPDSPLVDAVMLFAETYLHYHDGEATLDEAWNELHALLDRVGVTDE